MSEAKAPEWPVDADITKDEAKAMMVGRRPCRPMAIKPDGKATRIVIVERPSLTAFECWLDAGKGNTATKQLVLDSLVYPTKAKMLELADDVPNLFAGTVGAEVIGLVGEAGKVEVLKL